MKTLASRLNWARNEKNLTQGDLAKKSGVSQSTIGNLEAGIRLSSRSITLIAAALGVDALWLAEGKGKPVTLVPADFSQVIVADSNNPDLIEIRKVKLRLSAGISGFEMDQETDDGQPLAFRKSWFEKNGYAPEKLIAVKVRGESMEPALYEGDTVVINTADRSLKDGEVFAVNYEGEAVVKRLVRDIGEWWLYSDNTDQRKYHKKICRGDACIIIGRVVQKQSERI